MSKTRSGARLNRDTLLFTDVTVSLETRIGRSDANPVTLTEMQNMCFMFRGNGGETVELDGLLVMRAFTDRVLGAGSTQAIVDEITAIEAGEAPLFFADYTEDSNSKTHQVLALRNHSAVQKARNMAAVWTMQDHPLVSQTGPAVHANVKHRKVYWCMCIATCQLPWKDDNIELHPGDVYVKAATQST